MRPALRPSLRPAVLVRWRFYAVASFIPSALIPSALILAIHKLIII